MNKSRKSLLAFILAAVVATVAAGTVSAQPARVDEKDANAVSLTYKGDARAVDAKKYGQCVKGSICANGTLYAGKSSELWDPCGVRGGEQFSTDGWCVAYVKKA